MKRKFFPAIILSLCFAINGAAQNIPKNFIDVSGIDRNIHPGDNFYDYLNARWIKNNTIPGTRTSWGSFDMVHVKVQEQLKSIFKMLNAGQFKPGSEEQVLKTFYNSAMDSARVEALGIKAIQADLDEIDAINDIESLTRVLAQHHLLSLGTTAMFSEGGIADPIRNDEEVIYFSQGGTGLPEKNYYFDTDSSSREARAGYKQMLAELFVLAGNNAADAAVKADSLLALETRLAGSSRTAEENRNIMRLLNYYTNDKMQQEFPVINWKSFLAAMGAAPNRIIVAQPEFFKNLDKELTATPLAIWKDYMKARLLVGAAPYLSSAFTKTVFNFYNKKLSGQKEPKPRWEKATSWTDAGLGEMLGKIYIKKNFSAAAKQRIDELINNLVIVYRERIQQLDWMTDATKQKALLKLDSLRRKIAYPDKWTDYSGVAIGKDLFANIKATSLFNAKRAIARIGKPVDRKLWTMTPQTVNAYYNPLNNEIVFPAGILAFPFFDARADDAMNYGGIGMVIGHEISHGFDDQGSQFDASGKFMNWWAKADKDAFSKKGEQLAKQFDQYVVVDTLKVNGRLTLGENIGDLGGLTAAYYAFKKTKQYKEGKKIDGFTPEQRFFLSVAQIWKSKASPESERQQTLTDPHTVSRYRVLGPLSNFAPFYEAFGVQSHHKMWRSPENRVVIW
ncbi:MAG: M13 family metallopeptidase [Dinghuibacter sp.]|nr:M13 family metallopeptidase [Dinghuibacter sp.]